MIAKTKITENLRVLNSVHFVMFVGTVSILFASIVVVILYNGVIVGNTLLNSYSYTASTENSNAAHPLIKGNPAKWTCEDVSQWFTDAGYPELAKKLLDQKFDGEAIMLLKREHFISLIYRNEETNFFGLKLGPALEVHALIEELKKASKQMSE
ncbi:polyhomeotic-like protein 1 [Ditylenchus destructor]|nr:polyhomeotic-like protein 1 [Ditylenchus destructor]